MTRIYEKNEHGQDIVRTTVHEQDESGKWIDRECVLLVDERKVFARGRWMTQREFDAIMNDPETKMEAVHPDGTIEVITMGELRQRAAAEKLGKS
jgi:hypothetical protein